MLGKFQWSCILLYLFQARTCQEWMFCQKSQDLKLWWDFTTFKLPIISAFKVLSSKTKEEISPFCISIKPTLLIFKKDWGERGPSFWLTLDDFEDCGERNNLITFLVGVKSIGATTFPVNDFIAQFRISFASFGYIFRNPKWVLWIAKPTFLNCWFRMRFWHYLVLKEIRRIKTNKGRFHLAQLKQLTTISQTCMNWMNIFSFGCIWLFWSCWME